MPLGQMAIRAQVSVTFDLLANVAKAEPKTGEPKAGAKADATADGKVEVKTGERAGPAPGR